MNNLMLSSDFNPLWFFAMFFGFSLVFFAITIPFILRWQRERKREKADKRAHKLEEKKLSVELELAKNKANFEIEKEREMLKPRFCRYCGARKDNDTEKCGNCGA